MVHTTAKMLGATPSSRGAGAMFGHDFSRSFLASLHLPAVGLGDALQAAHLLHAFGLHTRQSSRPHRCAVGPASSDAVAAGLLSRLARLAAGGSAPGPLGRCVCGPLAFAFLGML
mgnify:CR=1 FL=1